MTQNSFVEPHPARPSGVKPYALILAVVWTLVVGGLCIGVISRRRADVLELARIQAHISFQKDVVYRRWAAGHGGVYVPATPKTPPNPYLSHVDNRDIVTESGLALTLVNPAYMTRQVHELGREQYGHRGHITSLNPLRPENAPDPWEAEALKAFEQGESEKVSLEMIEGEGYLRLMHPLFTEESCLKCHAHQGYQTGDVRGGISVSIPMAPLWAVTDRQEVQNLWLFGVIWMAGLGTIGFGARNVAARVAERNRAEAALVEAERSRVLVETATAAAHEINQPLTVILGMSQLLLYKMQPGDDRRPDLEAIARSGGSIEAIVRRMVAAREYVTTTYVGESKMVDLDGAARAGNGEGK